MRKSLLSKVVNAEAKFFVPHPKKDRKAIGSDDLAKLLRKEFGKDASVYLVDWDYHLIDYEEMERFLAEDKTDLAKYVAEYHDCDDFSFRLMGQVSIPGWSDIAFGIVFVQTPTGGHALNCFISNEEEVLLIEPQSDEIFIKPSDWKVFFCLM